PSPPRPTLVPYTTLFRSAAAKAKLDVARTEGVAAKAGLRTSQISQLSRELRAHSNGERLLTKPAAQAQQEGQQQNQGLGGFRPLDRKSTRLNSSHVKISY